jgi:uncharacterized protein (DUF2252 family)
MLHSFDSIYFKDISMKLRILFTGLALTAFSLAIPVQTEAATSRQAWLVEQIYNYNHPFAANLPKELAVKMAKIDQTPFAFYRGTAHLFYEDVKNTKEWPVSHYTNAITNGVWLQGDMHLQNMGGFRDAKGNTVFDTNDFDEGYWGSYTWDLRRMAVSILLAAEENKISSEDSKKLVENFVDSYVEQMAVFAQSNNLESDFRLTVDNTSGIVKETIKGANDKKRAKLLDKNTKVNATSQRHFISIGDASQPCIKDPCLQPVDSQTLSAINAAMPSYINSIADLKPEKEVYYKLKDAALRLGSGTGSLGRYRYYLLIDGDSTKSDDDVILEMKQETSSAVAIAAPNNMPAEIYNHHEGLRVAKSMKAMLSNADDLVGYTTMNDLPFFLRERSPFQEDFKYSDLNYEMFNDVVVYMGKVMAKNHALADNDAKLIPYSMEKEITDVINGDVSGLKKETLDYAIKYADQVKQDFNDFKDAFKKAKENGKLLY